MIEYLAGCATVGLIWGFRGWLKKRADEAAAALKADAQKAADQVKAKL